MAPYNELWRLVDSIPAGKVVSYGELGRALPHPVSGLLVGRWLRNCPVHVPWWRVVGKDGTLLLAKLSPELAFEQQNRLLAEGVTFEGDRVTTVAFMSLLELFAEE